MEKGGKEGTHTWRETRATKPELVSENVCQAPLGSDRREGAEGEVGEGPGRVHSAVGKKVIVWTVAPLRILNPWSSSWTL